jgi:hypothetical protein
LCLGTTGSGLHIEKSIAGIHVTGEHSPKLEFLDLALKVGQIALNRLDAVFIVLFDGHRQQFTGVVQAAVKLFKNDYDFFQTRPVLAKLLRLLWIIPDVWLFQFADNFLELLLAAVEVKDTP